MATLSSKFCSEATLGPNCSQKSHLGIPGWSGIGFKVILGYLWTSLGEVNSQVFRQAADLGRFFLGTFVRCFLGRLFGRFYIDGLIPGDVKSTQTHEGCSKSRFHENHKSMFFDTNHVQSLRHFGRLRVTFSDVGSAF